MNWIAGIVHAELPRQFDQRKAAEAELSWCLENADKAPHAGWLRRVPSPDGQMSLASMVAYMTPASGQADGEGRFTYSVICT